VTAGLRAWLPPALHRRLTRMDAAIYRWGIAAVSPLNRLLARRLAGRYRPGSVLHVSALVHVPYYMTRILRDHGVAADYLAVGDSPWWDRADFHVRPSRVAPLAVLQELWWVWTVVRRYEIVHAHFIVTVSRSGWEWPLLRAMGRHIVVHYRGCEIRNRERNLQLHPAVNICQDCDYDPRPCATPLNAHRRQLAREWGSAFLVTTPDMKDFAPQAIHVPFFVTTPPTPARERDPSRPFTIVHATNHAGIEGTAHIRRAVEAVRARGHELRFVELTGVTHAAVLDALAEADLSIGKMKMGYYANLQIESMMAGVPTVTHVRPELMTTALRESGFIFATLDTLAETIEYYVTHPDALTDKRQRARASIQAMHDNAAIARQYEELYRGLRAGEGTAGRV